MKILFMGTPDFAVPTLRALMENHYKIIAVITQPDRPKGRKKKLSFSSVKEVALEYGLPIFQPTKLREKENVIKIRDLAPDLIVTCAYGQILPQGILDLPRFGSLNVHGSLLPKYRGGAPIQRAIMQGEKITGVTLMYMAAGLDTGDMISQVSVPILDEDTAGSLFRKLSHAGANLLLETLPSIIAGTAACIPQKEDQATYAPNLTREDEHFDWSKTSQALYDQMRGLSPSVGAFTKLDGKVFKIWGCRLPSPDDLNLPPEWEDCPPGTIIDAFFWGIRVKTRDGYLVLTEVQPAGKKKIAAGEYAKGNPCHFGMKFE